MSDLVTLSLQDLGERLHDAVEDVLARYRDAQAVNDGASARGGTVPQLRLLDDAAGPWTYRWPNGSTERYHHSTMYELAIDDGKTRRIRVARTTRWAWNRDRGRAVIFMQVGTPDAWTHYPWAEFVETDDGLYAATVPNPVRPRALLTANDQLPEHIQDAEVRRVQECFGGHGKTLRVVVTEEDETAMVRHGLWVAQTRRRL